MKGLLLLATMLFAGFGCARAQNIALGERVPELKIGTWLDNRRPTPAPLTYIEFYHSSTPTGTASIEQLRHTADAMGGKLHVVVIARESAEKIATTLRPFLSPNLCVGIDPTGQIFGNFGVSYLPFGVLVDAKNRALWMGNSLQINAANIDKIAQ